MNGKSRTGTIYEIILTEHCNWKCSYCQFPTIRNPQDTSIEKINKHIDYIRDIINKVGYDYIMIQGGEIGLVDKDVLKHFLSKFNKKIIIDTNGLFIDKGYHTVDGIKEYIEEIWWHTIDEPRKIKIDNKDTGDIKLVPGVVGCNVDNIIAFLDINKHIDFDYVFIEVPITAKNVDCDYVKKSYEKLYNYCAKYRNKKTILNNLLCDIREYDLQLLQKACCTMNAFNTINLASEKLCLCTTRSNQVQIDLTRDNLINVLTKSNVFRDKSNALCNTCYRSSRKGHDMNTLLNKQKYRSVLL